MAMITMGDIAKASVDRTMDAIIILVVVPLVVSIVANLLTDRFKAWWGKRALTSIARTAKQLRDDIEVTAKLHNSIEQLIIHTVQSFTQAVLFLSFGVLTGITTLLFLEFFPVIFMTPSAIVLAVIIAESLTAFLIFYGLYSLVTLAQRLSNVANFDEYKIEAEKRLIELER